MNISLSYFFIREKIKVGPGGSKPIWTLELDYCVLCWILSPSLCIFGILYPVVWKNVYDNVNVNVSRDRKNMYVNV